MFEEEQFKQPSQEGDTYLETSLALLRKISESPDTLLWALGKSGADYFTHGENGDRNIIIYYLNWNAPYREDYHKKTQQESEEAEIKLLTAYSNTGEVNRKLLSESNWYAIINYLTKPTELPLKDFKNLTRMEICKKETVKYASKRAKSNIEEAESGTISIERFLIESIIRGSKAEFRSDSFLEFLYGLNLARYRVKHKKTFYGMIPDHRNHRDTVYNSWLNDRRNSMHFKIASAFEELCNLYRDKELFPRNNNVALSLGPGWSAIGFALLGNRIDVTIRGIHNVEHPEQTRILKEVTAKPEGGPIPMPNIRERTLIYIVKNNFVTLGNRLIQDLFGLEGRKIFEDLSRENVTIIPFNIVFQLTEKLRSVMNRNNRIKSLYQKSYVGQEEEIQQNSEEDGVDERLKERNRLLVFLYAIILKGDKDKLTPNVYELTNQIRHDICKEHFKTLANSENNPKESIDVYEVKDIDEVRSKMIEAITEKNFLQFISCINMLNYLTRVPSRVYTPIVPRKKKSFEKSTFERWAKENSTTIGKESLKGRIVDAFTRLTNNRGGRGLSVIIEIFDSETISIEITSDGRFLIEKLKSEVTI